MPSSSPLLLRPATRADLPSLVEIYFSAFRGSPLSSTVFPESSPSSHKFFFENLGEEMLDPRAHFLVVTETDGVVAITELSRNQPAAAATPRIIAFAKWVSPPPLAALPSAAATSTTTITTATATESVQPSPPIDAWPREGNPEFADRFFGASARRHAEIMGDAPHWYLELIACRAEDQGRGAGGMLMRWGCERIDAERNGSLAFLEAVGDPEGDGAMGMYKKFGFVLVDRMDFETPHGMEVVRQSFMVREGKAVEAYREIYEREHARQAERGKET